MQYYGYILASQRNGTLYIGVTRDLVKRTWQHKSDVVESFTSSYGMKFTARSTPPSPVKNNSRSGTVTGRRR